VNIQPKKFKMHKRLTSLLRPPNASSYHHLLRRSKLASSKEIEML